MVGAGFERLCVEYAMTEAPTIRKPATRKPARAPKRQTLAERKAKTRTRIIAAASALFRDKGYEDTSVAMVAHRAKTGVGTLYGYFPSKDDLLHEVLWSLGQETVAEYGALLNTSKTPLDQMFAVLDLWSKFLLANGPIVRGVFQSGRSAELGGGAGKALYDMVAGLLQDGMDQGVIRKLPADTTGRMLLSTYLVAVLRIGPWASVEDTAAMRQELETIARTLLTPD